MIIVLGSINADLVLTTSHLPAPGETVRASGLAMHPGGKGANQAVAAARVGADARLIGRVGDDTNGEAVVRAIGASGVSTSLVGVDSDAPTGLALITVDAAGANTIVTSGGANHRVGEADLAAVEEAISTADVFVVQLEIPMGVVASAIRIASAAGVPVVLDPAPVAEIPEELYRHVTWITPNETEAQALTGIAPVDPGSAMRAAEALVDKGVANAVVTLGERGCVLVGAAGTLQVASPRVTAVDTVACGDAFTGLLAAEIAWGAEPNNALTVACAAGAAAATKPGAYPSLPDKEAIDRLLS